jgi:hypothetical protein
VDEPDVAFAPLDRLISMVAGYGMDRDRAAMIASYLADRCAGLSVSTLHSSSTGALRSDPYLVDQLGLGRRQIAAWLALMRGTRAVRRRNGDLVGGCRGFIEDAARSGPAEASPRFQRLAQLAAGNAAQPCDRRGEKTRHRPMGRCTRAHSRPPDSYRHVCDDA